MSLGKTHVTRVAGVIEQGIIIIIIPLLTLSADQMAKFSCGDQCYKTIEAHHMDEVYKESYKNTGTFYIG